MINLTFDDIRKLMNDTTTPSAEDWVYCGECKCFINRFDLNSSTPQGEYGFCRMFGGVHLSVSGCYLGVKKEEEK